MILHVAEPWRLHRMLFAFPRAARNPASPSASRGAPMRLRDYSPCS